MSDLIENPVIKTLDELFDRSTRYQIPLYQRDFSWGEAEVAEFLEDIFELDESESSEHFFGTIVLSNDSPGESISGTERIRYVIDGQQRLTASLLFLAVIRHQFESLAATQPTVHRNIKTLDELLHLGDDEPHDQVPRLTANRANQEFLQSILTAQTKVPHEVREAFASLNRSKKQDSRRIKNAYDKIQDEIYRRGAKALGKAATDDEKMLSSLVDDLSECNTLINEFWRISKLFREKSTFVQITVKKWEDAFSLFDGLNNRGLDLAKRDIIKNFVLAQTSLRQREADAFGRLLGEWKEIEGLIPEAKFGNFLRHFLLLENEVVQLKSVIRTFVKSAQGKSAEDLLRELHKAAINYADILDPLRNRDAEISQQLVNLKVLSVERCYPILLAAKLKPLSKQNELKLLRAIEVLYFRRSAICQMDNKELEPMIQSVAAELYENGATNLSWVLETIDSWNPTDDEFRTNFSVRRGIDAGIARYFLLKIENDLRHGHRIQVSTLEHIMPQDPREHWGLELDETTDILIQSLGNLTLLVREDNSSLRNSSFDVKQEMYRREGLKINDEVINASSWGAGQIRDRQNWLADQICRLWPRHHVER